MTPVVFRAERSGQFKGDVTAVLPTIPAGFGEMTCYAHIGQHSGCTQGWYNGTRAAREAEYADLLGELRQQGYDDLKVYRRVTRQMRDERNKAERAI